MAKVFCIPKQLADPLTEAAKRGEIDIAQLYDMSSKQRRDVFAQYTNETVAREINQGFEGAMISNQKVALAKWAEATFSGKQKKQAGYKDVVAKINDLDELGLLNTQQQEAFLEDLVSSKLGVTITADEAQEISKRAAKLEELAQDESYFGTPTVEYFQSRKDMEDYLDSVDPTSRIKTATSIIGRGTLLTSIKSPVLNIVSNTAQGVLQAVERRITTRELVGVNNDYAIKYMKFVNDVYQKSGYDVSRMEHLQSERRIRGEERISSHGPGAVRKVGRLYEDVIFKQLMGAPDVAFSAAHFADSANLMSAHIAHQQGLRGAKAKSRALEIFADATRIDPQTTDGQIVRAQARADAEYSTYTNNSTYSDIGLGIRKVFNIATKDLSFGDLNMPFVKTPANVIGAGIEVSGVLVPVDTTIRMFNTLKDIKAGETVSGAALENFKGFQRTLIRAGLGMAFAYLLSALFDPEDFIGAYPTSPKERELLELKNATTNSVKIGNKWVSLDYFGPIGAPLVGMLYARKYGANLPDRAYYYVKGVGIQIQNFPGVEEIYQAAGDIIDLAKAETGTVEEKVGELTQSAIEFIRARTVPAIVYDIAKATDPYERRYSKDDALQRIQNTVPLAREDLPIDRNILGEERKNETAISVLLFGARIKTVNEGELLEELLRLDSEGQLPSITDPERTSPRMKELKTQLGENRFYEAKTEYGKMLKETFTKKINTGTYRRADDEDKKELLDKQKKDVFEKILKKYGYRKQKT